MVPIDKEFVEGILELGDCLNGTLLRHDIDILDMRLNPELGFISLTAKRIEDGKPAVEVFHASRFQMLDKTTIKIKEVS